MQIIFISGGDSYDSYDEFLADFRAQPLRIFENKKSWKETLITLEPAFQVLQIPMPNRENAKFEEWKIQFEKIFPFLEKDVILIGWSLGGIFLAQYLNHFSFPQEIKALHLIAAPYGKCGDFQTPKNLSKLEDTAKKIYLYHSKDDFVVPFEDSEKYAQVLPEAIKIDFKNRNHFLQSEFPELLKNIQEAE